MKNEILKLPKDSVVYRSYDILRIEVIENYKYLIKDKVWPGIIKMLNRLKIENDLYIITLRNNRKNLLKQLKYFNLVKYFKEIINGNHLSSPWETKIGLLKNKIIDPADTIIIGDTEADIIAGNKLEIITCAVRSGIRNDNHLKLYKPNYILDNANELEKLINKKIIA